MVQIGIMIVIAAAMFWWLPLWIAVVGAIVLFFLIAAKLRDAVTRGRVHMILRKKDDDDEAQRIRDRDATFLYAMWIGLTIAGPAHSGSGDYIHHPGGGDFSGDSGGGFDGGGGDGGM